MTKRKNTKIVKEGNYLAEIDVEMIDSGEGWAPFISLEDARKLDEVREALRLGDIETAAKKAKVFILKPIAV
jgi:hypothetical protein